jgi:cell wall-associated protease
LRLYNYFIFIFFVVLSCKSKNDFKINNDTNFFAQNWYHLDSDSNSANGIALQKLYVEKKINKNKKNIIVAVLDSQIDLNHEDLENQIWINKRETPNNNIDDDDNGYVDDYNGWNFVGKPNGGCFSYCNFEYTRMLQKWNNYFKNKSYVNSDSLLLFNEYKRAKEYHSIQLINYSTTKKIIDFRIKHDKIIEDTISYFFPDRNFNLVKLDSLFKIYKLNDKTFKQRIDDNDLDLGSLIKYKMGDLKSNVSNLESIKIIGSQNDSILNYNLNVFFNDRALIEENLNSILKGYGNGNLNLSKNLNTHSTYVSSVISGRRKNKKGISGFHDNIKVMPLSISISGDEHDKDIANAIYYAVDNGAKVINMSFGKEFSLEKQWVFDALKYAEKNNVLVVHSSGNDASDIDNYSNYPNDNDYYNKKEIVDNFINVGSISKRADSTMVSPFSNYGKENVDIFAPGEEIYVAKPNNEYGYDSGTSLAGPMVSGTAALIWLYYPKLTVHQVKNIILESGISIDKMVVKPGTKDEMVPFSDLCKTGKILNTYNAMMLAKKVSKQ